MKLNRRFEKESSSLLELRALARKGDELSILEFKINESTVRYANVSCSNGRFVIKIKEGELSPRPDDYMKDSGIEEAMLNLDFQRMTDIVMESPTRDEEGRAYREGDLPDHLYLLDEDLSTIRSCGVQEDIVLAFAGPTGIFWCKRDAQGIYFSGDDDEVLTVYDGFLESAFRPFREPSGHISDRITEPSGEPGIWLRDDIWQVDAEGTVYLKTPRGFTRIKTKDGAPIETSEILPELAERIDYPTIEWGAYGDSLWVHLREKFIRVGSDGKVRTYDFPTVPLDRMWRYEQRHKHWVARDAFLAVDIDGVLHYYHDGEEVLKIHDFPGEAVPLAVSEGGIVYSFSEDTFVDKQFRYVRFDGKVLPLNLHSKSDNCWITSQGIVCLQFNYPTLILAS